MIGTGFFMALYDLSRSFGCYTVSCKGGRNRPGAHRQRDGKVAAQVAARAPGSYRTAMCLNQVANHCKSNPQATAVVSYGVFVLHVEFENVGQRIGHNT